LERKSTEGKGKKSRYEMGIERGVPESRSNQNPSQGFLQQPIEGGRGFKKGINGKEEKKLIRGGQKA